MSLLNNVVFENLPTIFLTFSRPTVEDRNNVAPPTTRSTTEDKSCSSQQSACALRSQRPPQSSSAPAWWLWLNLRHNFFTLARHCFHLAQPAVPQDLDYLLGWKRQIMSKLLLFLTVRKFILEWFSLMKILVFNRHPKFL